MVSPLERAWASGEEVDVLREDGQWWPGAIVGPDDGDAASYRVRMQGSTGGLQPPHGCDAPAAQEERGVTPGQLVPAGQHVPRWRLCGREELVEVKVGGEWRRGTVFARYERRWFEAIIYIVDMLTRRVLISYLGWPKAPLKVRYGSLAEEWISFDSPRLRRLRRPRGQPQEQGGAAAAVAHEAADGSSGCGGEDGEWNVGDRAEVLVDQLEDEKQYVFWRYQGGYAHGVMGKEDHPLQCTLGVDVLTAAFTACAPDDAPAGGNGAGSGSGSGGGVGVAAAATNTDGPCPPPLSEACCYSSSSSAGTTDGAHGGMRPVAGEGGEGEKGAHTFVYFKASSVDLAAPGTHLPACSLKQLGLDKPPSTPAPLLAPPSALSQPLVAPPPVWV